LRAQLIEEGCSVRAYESLRDATGVLALGAARARSGRGFQPALLIVDFFEDGSAEEVDRLSRLARRLPVWVIAAHSRAQESDLSNRGFERVLFRPVDVRDLVERIKRRVGSASAESQSVARPDGN
jgi:hypothetical protein